MTDDDVHFTITSAGMICLTVVIVALIVCSFGSCVLLDHREGQADRRIRCIELVHDVEKCSSAFEGNK